MSRSSITDLFGLGSLTPATRRSLYLVFSSSLLMMMGVNLVQPVLPAMIEPLGISEAEVGLVIAVYTAPAVVLTPLLGIAADLYGRRFLLAAGLIIYFFHNNLQWFGRLPGDIVIDKPNLKLYFPITTMLLISIFLSLILWIFRKFIL